MTDLYEGKTRQLRLRVTTPTGYAERTLEYHRARRDGLSAARIRYASDLRQRSRASASVRAARCGLPHTTAAGADRRLRDDRGRRRPGAARRRGRDHGCRRSLARAGTRPPAAAQAGQEARSGILGRSWQRRLRRSRRLRRDRQRDSRNPRRRRARERARGSWRRWLRQLWRRPRRRQRNGRARTPAACHGLHPCVCARLRRGRRRRRRRGEGVVFKSTAGGGGGGGAGGGALELAAVRRFASVAESQRTPATEATAPSRSLLARHPQRRSSTPAAEEEAVPGAAARFSSADFACSKGKSWPSEARMVARPASPTRSSPFRGRSRSCSAFSPTRRAAGYASTARCHQRRRSPPRRSSAPTSTTVLTSSPMLHRSSSVGTAPTPCAYATRVASSSSRQAAAPFTVTVPLAPGFNDLDTVVSLVNDPRRPAAHSGRVTSDSGSQDPVPRRESHPSSPSCAQLPRQHRPSSPSARSS